MEEKIKFSGKKKSDYLKKNINNEYCFQKCIQFFSPSKSSMDRQSAAERVICGITLFSFSIGHWLAPSNLIWKEKKRTELCFYGSRAFWSLLNVLYRVEVVVSRSAASLLNSCIWSNYVWFAGKLPQSIGRIVATPYSPHSLFYINSVE